MVYCIPNVLSDSEITEARVQLDAADWSDGKTSAGHLACRVKNNAQLSVPHPLAEQIGARILAALASHPVFLSAALPLHVLPPMFNRYAGGQNYGTHVDGAIRLMPGSHKRIRTDMSCTLFFSNPEEYAGGELLIEDTYGGKSVKLPAGHLVLYPATSLHRVTPVTRGVRVCAVFWLQSLLRDETQRALLFDMDQAIQQLAHEQEAHPCVVSLTGIYHNLLRQWSET